MGDKAEKNDLNNHKALDPKIAHGIWEMIGNQTAIKSRAQFRAYVSSAQSNITHNTWIKVVLDGESFDVGGYFDAVTDYDFTAPTDGLYALKGQVKLTSVKVNTNNYLAIYKNGAAISTTYVAGNGIGQDIVLQVNDFVQLAADDLITLYVYSGADDTTDIVTGEANSFLCGHMVALV